MKRVIPVLISFLSWIVITIIDTIIEIQDTSLADTLTSIFSHSSWTRITIMGIKFNPIDSSYGITLHFFVVLILFLLVGLIFAYKKEISNYIKNINK